jgi:hypothetical protein
LPDVENVQALDELFNAGREARRPFEPDAYLNVAFYLGNQWTRWDGSRVFRVPEALGLETDNRIMPAIRTEIAKMTKTRPKYVAVPRTQSDADIAGSRYAELAVDDAWKRHALNRKLRQALLWSRLAPKGYWKVWWDPTVGPAKDVLVHTEGEHAGRVVRDGRGGPWDPQTPLPDGYPPTVQRSVALGDICVEVRTFFHLVVDPYATEDGLESAEWVCEEAVFSRDHVERRFPDFVNGLNFDTDPSPGMLESRFAGGSGRGAGFSRTKGTRLREMWSRDWHVIWAPGGMEVLREPNPYPWLPYVEFSGLPAPGRFYGDSVVTHMRPQQVALNKRITQIENNADRIANPPLLIPSTMGDDWQWQGLPAEEVRFTPTGDPNAMPSFMPVPELPGYVQADPERIQQSILEISGQHEVSGAQVPAGVTAASAISMLQEADDTRLGPDVSAMEDSLAEAGKRILFFVRNYYTDERHLAISSEGGRWDVLAFKGPMVAGVESIEVQAGSGMPSSKAAKQAAIQQLLTLFTQNGQIISARDYRKILSEFEVGGLEHLFASVNRDEQQVEDENRRLSMGEAFEINSYDNDEAHVAFHHDFMKTSTYSALPPQVKAIFEEHVVAHMFRMTPPPMAPPDMATSAGAPTGSQDPGMPQPAPPSQAMSGSPPSPAVPSPSTR